MSDKEILKKQKAEQAPMPPPPAFIREMIEEVKEPVKKPTGRDEKVLTELADSDAWGLVKEYISEFTKRIEQATLEKVAESPINIEEIGYRYMISTQIKGALNNVLLFVDKYGEVAKQRTKEVLDAEKSSTK